MGRVAWSFNGYSFPINPEKSSGFVKDPLLAERVPIQANKSNIQRGGLKSGRIVVSGMLFGENSDSMKNMFDYWLENGTVGDLVDHQGIRVTAMLVKFDPETVRDIKAWKCGRQTWSYSAEFVAM